MASQETLDHIEKMVASIVERGTLHFPPISVYQKDGEVYLITGHCRREAFIEARRRGAPVKGILAVANTQSEEERTLDLLDSNDGLPLTMVEKAIVVKRLVSFGWTPTEIAKKRGVTVKAISDLLLLLEAPEEIKNLVQDGKVSATLAIEVTKENPQTAVATLTEAVQVAENQGKAKATRKHVKDPAEARIKTSFEKRQTKLKPCPFCGSHLVPENDEVYRHTGDTCYLSGASVDATEEEMWNQRG
jgi:ParB-like chromosome segregation protein Spo0J